MKSIKLGSAKIPPQEKSLTASYNAINWKKIPVSNDKASNKSQVNRKGSSEV